MATLKDMVGLTMVSVTKSGDELIFQSAEGRRFRLYHWQDCCESVYIESIVGDLADLECAPLLRAEESTSTENPKPGGDYSFTWTFYKFATRKGYVDVRWYGSSNGYYSERVDFEETTPVRWDLPKA